MIALVDADPDLRDPRVIATDINKGNPQIARTRSTGCCCRSTSERSV